MAQHTSPNREPSGDGHPTTSVRRSDPFSVSSLLVDGAAVLSLSGRVDLTSLPVCRRAVDTLLRDGVRQITVDLQVARFDDESIALLALMRRYTARHGIRMILAEIPPHVGELLDRTGVRWLYRDEEAAGTGKAGTAGGTDAPGGPGHTGHPANTWTTRGRSGAAPRQRRRGR